MFGAVWKLNNTMTMTMTKRTQQQQQQQQQQDKKADAPPKAGATQKKSVYWSWHSWYDSVCLARKSVRRAPRGVQRDARAHTAAHALALDGG